MDPTLAAAISMVAAALATAILRYAAYRWPVGYHHREAVRNRNDEEPDAPDEPV